MGHFKFSIQKPENLYLLHPKSVILSGSLIKSTTSPGRNKKLGFIWRMHHQTISPISRLGTTSLIPFFSKCFELVLRGSVISPWCCMLTKQRSIHLPEFHHLCLCLEDNHNSQTYFPTLDLIQAHIRPTSKKKNVHHYMNLWNLSQHKQHSILSSVNHMSFQCQRPRLVIAMECWVIGSQVGREVECK